MEGGQAAPPLLGQPRWQTLSPAPQSVPRHLHGPHHRGQSPLNATGWENRFPQGYCRSPSLPCTQEALETKGCDWILQK